LKSEAKGKLWCLRGGADQGTARGQSEGEERPDIAAST